MLEQPSHQSTTTRLDAVGMQTSWCWQDPHVQPQAAVPTSPGQSAEEQPAHPSWEGEPGPCPGTQLVSVTAEVTRPGAPAATEAEPVGSLGPALPALCSSWVAPQARQRFLQ